MSIQIIKKSSDTDQEMESYHKNLRGHRLRSFGITLGAAALVMLGLFGVYIGWQNRTFEICEVTESFERTDTMTTQYTEFMNYVLKYSKDGVSCVDSENRLVWSQTYNMQNPMIQVCAESVAIAEEKGTEALIFGSDGLQGSVQTRLPIQQIAISGQGVLAVLLEDGEIMRLNLYNKAGEELVSSKFELKETGYPLRMSLSEDATKLAVEFLQVEDGGVNTCLAFYNFDSVGENYEDHLVASQVVSGQIMPSVKYVDQTHCFAVGTGTLLLYEGTQIPELKAEIPIDREIYSVFYSGEEAGLVVAGQEQAYALRVYNVQGKLEFEKEFEMEYSSLKFSGENILIYNDFEYMMMNHSGTVLFSGSFEESISNLYTLKGKNRYIVMHAARTDHICLR